MFHENIQVSRVSENFLGCVLWEFWLDGTTLWLDRYDEMTRKTKRHKFKSLITYKRTDQRYNTMAIEDIVIPEDVKQEATYRVIEKLTVKKWEK